MPRASDILILLTYVMIAVVAAIGFEYFGLMSTATAWMMGAIVFIVAGMAHSAATHAHERRTTEEEIRGLKS